MKLFIGLAIFLSSPAWIGAQTRPVVKLQADVWCPFNCKDTDANPGYMVEIAKIAFDSIKMDVEYKNKSWNKAIDEARKGVTNGIIGAAVTDAPDFIYPSNALGRSKNCFFTAPSSTWSFTDAGSLKKARIGVIEGYTYGEPFETYVQAYLAEKAKELEEEKKKNPKAKAKDDINSLIQAVPGDQALALNMKKVNAKPPRIEAFVEDESVLKNHLHAAGQPETTFRNAGCLKPDNLSIAFGPNDPKGKEYAKALSDTVVALRKDGRLKKILDKYGISDWEK
jgi:polar amino acid transport system substrate-binding protein